MGDAVLDAMYIASLIEVTIGIAVILVVWAVAAWLWRKWRR